MGGSRIVLYTSVAWRRCIGRGTRLNSESSRAGVLPNKKSHSVERLGTFGKSQDSARKIAP